MVVLVMVAVVMIPSVVAEGDTDEGTTPLEATISAWLEVQATGEFEGDGVQFGAVDPGTEENPATGNGEDPSYVLELDEASNVEANLTHKIPNLGDYTFDEVTILSSAQINETGFIDYGDTNSVEGSYELIGADENAEECSDIGIDDQCIQNFWIDVEEAVSPGTLETEYHFCGEYGSATC